MVNLLIANLTSFGSILATLRELAPESALGTVQRNLISQALDLARIQQPAISASADIKATPQKRSKKFNSEVPVDMGQKSPLSNIDVSPNRIHAAVVASKHSDDSDSDFSPFDHDAAIIADKHRDNSDSDFSPSDHSSRNKRKTEQTHHQPTRPSTTEDLPQPTPSDAKPTAQFTPINHPKPTTSPSNPSPTPLATTTKQKKRRPHDLGISTALPPNSPPLGANCHCHASSDDPTLVACEGCRKLYHPRCVGKGIYARGTYNQKDEIGYMLEDVEKFCQEDDRDGLEYGDGWEFRCGDCD